MNIKNYLGEKTSHSTIMPLSEYITNRLKLIKNSKAPVKGEKVERIVPHHYKQKINLNYNNWGILTGEKSNLTGVDLDLYKWGEDHPFIQRFGSDYIERFQTLTQKTTSGGIHLIFEYTPELPQTQGLHEIDIRNNGGYLVGAGSKVNGKAYEVVVETTPKPIPTELCEWLKQNIYSEEELKTKGKKRGTKTTNPEAIFTSYDYLFTEEQFENEIVKHLPTKYFTEYKDWVKFLTFCKATNNYNLANKYRSIHRDAGSKWHDENFFNSAWNTIKKHNQLKIVEFMLKEAKRSELLPYLKYKAVPTQIAEPTKVIETEKLGYELELEPNKNYILKSDTGTGKTTLFKHYIANQRTKFISIVSRISLADEQYRVFNEYGIECAHYQNMLWVDKGSSMVITIDSIMKLQYCDFREYVVFMDEFNSILEYLIQADTCLGEKRTLVLQVLCSLLKNCKQLIGVDADISDLCFYPLKELELDYEYIQNTYKHNKGTNAYELESIDSIISHVEQDRNENKAVMVCCDSKQIAEYIYSKTDEKALLITSETTETPIFDEHEFIIFSPKIIYGIDGNWKGGRNVYCVMKEYTISPKNMVQQLARERNINELYYYFAKKEFEPCDYNNMEECKLHMVEKHRYALSQFDIFEGSYDSLFFNMLCQYEYIQDCYGTNKFAHFLNIITTRGFELCSKQQKTAQLDNTTIDEVVMELRKENFDVDSEYVAKLNTYLKMKTPELMKKHIDYFISPKKLANHFNRCELFFKGEGEEHHDKHLYEHLKGVKEFPIKKIETTRYKVLVLNELKKLGGYTEEQYTPKPTKKVPEPRTKTIFKATTGMSELQSETMNQKYKTVFGGRCEKLDLTKPHNITKMYSKMITNITGNEMVVSTKIRDGETTRNIQELMVEFIDSERAIWNLRKTVHSEVQNYAGVNVFIQDDEEEECEDI